MMSITPGCMGDFVGYPKIMAAACLLMAVAAPCMAHAAEIKVLSAGVLKVALTELAADFQISSGSAASVDYGPAAAIADRARQGEIADVVIVTRPQLEALETQGKVVQGSRVDIAGIALGVAVRKGAPKPDIGTVDAFKRALLHAGSIGYRDPATGSPSAIYTARMIERLGLTHALQSKTKLDRSPGDRPEHVFDGVASGAIELQIGRIPEIVIAPGVDLAGPLPGALQHVSVLAAGLATASKAPEAARAFISYMSSPAAAAVLKANGFQPVPKT
jgi:molybdate transport system substrate-binding protein